MMLDAGGTQAYVHMYASRPLYHCAVDADRNFIYFISSVRLDILETRV